MHHHSRTWPLQEAKARLSELLNIVEKEGPQIITVHGKPKAEIVPIGAAGRMVPTVDDIVEAFQACPVKDFEIRSYKTRAKHRGPQF